MISTIIHVSQMKERILSQYFVQYCFYRIYFQLAKLSEKKHTKYRSIIWNGFLSILNDSNLDVLLAIANNLLNVFIAFSRDENEGYVNGAICSIPAVRYKENKEL